MVVISEIGSSSSSSFDHRYDVFLSFRGADTRSNFTDHLYNTLMNANITTFLDDEEIETGLALKPELESAIKASRASIVVLSQNYASSTWCLDELVLILEQLRKPNYFLIPIFYHVEPTDVRKHQNSFKDAMAKHKQRMETETNAEKKNQWAQKIELWKKALTEVSYLKGEYIAKDRKEADFIEQIVTNIHRKLGVPLGSPQPLVIGMDRDIKYITSWLKDGSSHTGDILTISGMGGIGKTTLAKHVYWLNTGEFKRSSFIVDIGRKCAEKKIDGLLELQKQIFDDISKTRGIQGHDVSMYTSRIENALACTKVFLVLDDVDSLDQLDALLGSKGFHPGSKVIITTKDASLTERCMLFNRMLQPKHTKHLLQGLNIYKSLQLLSIWAFKRNKIKEGYEEVSYTLVQYCEGHPLALEVLGRSLCNKVVAVWKEYIKRLKEEPDSRIKKVLRMSFDSLPYEEDKELFKHIACFFVREDRESTETILKECLFNTTLGIENLIDRCLLWISEDNKLMMHQLLQEMGRDVVRQESPNRPEKRSRLWCHEESFRVLKQKKGKGKILGLALDTMRLMHEKDTIYELETDALSKMDDLIFLQLNHVHQLKGSYKNFPQELRWLCMHGFPLKSIPSDLPMENLVALDMSYSSLVSFDLRLWKRQKMTGSSPIYEQLCSLCGLLELPILKKNRQKLTGLGSKDKPLLRSLKILNLSYCQHLHTLGGFLEFPALERLILSNCRSLIEVSESIENCDGLVLIDLSYCIKVRNLSETIKKLKTRVKTLKLDGCGLGKFPIETRDDVEQPEMLNGNKVSINSETSSSVIVKAIPRALRTPVISSQSSLVCLSLKDNNLSNESFPKDMSSLSMLKELYLDGNAIISLPNCVRTLPRLKKLSIKDCDRLKTLEHPPCTLMELIIGFNYKVEKVIFDREMSPIKLTGEPAYFIEGMFKAEDIEDVNEEVLRRLGWSNLDFTNDQPVIEGMFKEEDIEDFEEEVLRYLGWSNLDFANDQPVKTRSKVQMVYEFGIFSTRYDGREMPNWISERSKEKSISFTIPSSPYNLRGLNLCFVYRITELERIIFKQPSMVRIRMHNVTKNRTWIYLCHVHVEFKPTRKSATFLSHWMLGKNEMEDGDQVDITILDRIFIRECGVSFVYDEDEDDKGKKKMEEDVLSYYKSWNYIIGGDLSPFQTTTPGEYYLWQGQFLGFCGSPHEYVVKRPLFKAFR